MCKIPKARAEVTVDSHICPKNKKKKNKKQKMESLRPIEGFHSEYARLRGQHRGFHCGIKSRACSFLCLSSSRAASLVLQLLLVCTAIRESVFTILDWTMENGS